MNHQRPPLSMRAHMVFEVIEDWRLLCAPLERYSEQTGRLVEHDQKSILIQHTQSPRCKGHRASFRAARAIVPNTHFVALLQTQTDLFDPRFGPVHKYFPARSGL